MARMRIFIVLVLAIAAGGVFAFGTYNYVQRIPPNTVTIPTTKVAVAGSDLDIGDEITKDSVRLIDWPSNAAPANAISDPNEVIGRGLVMPMIQNEPFLDLKLAPKEAGSGLPPAIPPGLRAVSVKVNEVIGVAGYVLPGTHVDVVATVNPTQNSTDVTSKVILTNVLVLAAGTKIEQGEADKKPIAVSVVTMLVDPQQAERLTLASTEGKIQLALRNPLDTATPVTPGIKTRQLLGAQATTPRASSRPGTGTGVTTIVTVGGPQDLSTVEVIRGDKRAREVVRQE
jgi:pilus assembly protein CpaB